jgi:hypothetical protein
LSFWNLLSKFVEPMSMIFVLYLPLGKEVQKKKKCRLD